MTTKTEAQKSDRLGLLPYLVERWSATLEHPARYVINEIGKTVEIVFTYERQTANGKWVKVKKSAVATTIDEAAQDLREQMALIAREGSIDDA